MITLLEEEVFVAKACGTTRIMSMLGKSESIFPFPHWSSRDRKSVIPPTVNLPNLKGTPLFLAPHISIAGVLVQYCASAERVVLSIPKHGLENLEKGLSNIALDSVVLLHSYYDDSVDGQIVWNPEENPKVGIDKMQVILKKGKSGDIFGGSFVAFVPQQPEDETILYEDGFMVMLSNGSWSLLRTCLCQGRNCLIQADTEKGLNTQVRFLEEEEKVEEKVEEVLKIPGSDEKNCDESTEIKQKSSLAEMMIMTPKHELDERVNIDHLASYAQKVIDSLTDYFRVEPVYHSLEGTGDVVLQLNLSRESGLDLKIGFRPSDPKGLLPDFKATVREIVQTVNLIPVRSGVVQFQLYFPVKKMGGKK
eukprot:TRINITY_DN12140_c0_g1_i4.p1 TRINITY_DN12140_c0_g1~~TRINITY_DN12140_c0_g1_i4.p1  ORF type:complete len:364 (+),score=85.17 TRINITY_DN12140_c0_g1_i4:235-1326(+)